MMQCSHTRSLTVLRLYAAILSVIWSDYNGRYCMPTGLTMQTKELESDLVAIQGQRHVRSRPHPSQAPLHLRCATPIHHP
jgi:hypothetical protein